MFSFNAPVGACYDCKGLSIKLQVDLDVLIENDELSLNQGAISYFKHIAGSENLEWQEFVYLCNYYNIDMNKPFKDLSEYEKQIAVVGSDIPLSYTLTSRSGNKNHRNGFIEGPKRRIERLYVETQSQMLRDWYYTFMMETICDTCNGDRLNEKALAVKIDGINIAQLTKMQIGDIYNFLVNMNISNQQKEISKLLVEEILHRLKFLLSVGLEYLTLSRMASTLSGGEAQRIRLATQIGSKLTGVLYVLDEPSIGLHQKDNAKLIETMKQMRDLGNTLIVVEHDEDTMLSADYLVDIGPRAGVHGGEVVAVGTPEEVMKCENSITGLYLSKKKKIAVPNVRRKGNGNYLYIKNATENNLKNIDVKIPLGTFTVITGVSGSGKSTLINDTLYRGVYALLHKKNKMKYGKCESIHGIENIDKIVNVSQEPIGRSPRSNPATYTGVFDFIRDVFANTIVAKEKGYDKGRFSFNVKGGRCEACRGDGVKKIGNWAFSGCSNLDYFAFGTNVEIIGEEAFSDCTNVNNIISYSVNPPKCGTQALDDINKWNCTLKVLDNSVTAYQSADQWRDFFFIESLSFDGKVATPIIKLDDKTISITCETEKASIYYTLDGTNPTVESALYSGPFTLEKNCTIKAVATRLNYENSDISMLEVTSIQIYATSISLDKTEASIEENSGLQLTATILPEHTTNKEVAWSSSDKWVATVDNTGLVTIHSAGEVIITATTTDGTNLSATCRINVYSGIDGVNGDDVIVATVGDNIVVKNARLGGTVNVYTSDGAMVKSVTATDESVLIEAPTKGIYVVVVDGKSFKVLVK